MVVESKGKSGPGQGAGQCLHLVVDHSGRDLDKAKRGSFINAVNKPIKGCLQSSNKQTSGLRQSSSALPSVSRAYMQPADKSNLLRSEAELELEQVRHPTRPHRWV